VVALLHRQSYVRELAAGDGRVRRYVDDGGAALLELIRLLDQAGVGISSISMSEPTLDDVFLRQTGRSLREDRASPQSQAGRAAPRSPEREAVR
jgi:ABC-2 type transport system ATP-binding protein